MQKNSGEEINPIQNSSYEKPKPHTFMTKEEILKLGWVEKTGENCGIGVCKIFQLNGTDLLWNSKTNEIAGTMKRTE